MKLINRNTLKLIVTNMFVFAMTFCVFSVSAHQNVEFEIVVNKDRKEEAEKNITNVKVIYNPVAEQINVNFKLAKQSTVVIKLMDALGNEVLGLSNGAIDAGTQALSFDTNGKVSPGFYFIKITSGSETVIKRISVR